MTVFKRRYFSYAKKHDKRLRQTFFGLHSRKTVPLEFRQKVMRIYQQELENFR